MNLPDTERAYIAGLIDGEGSISCVLASSGQIQLFVAVEMCSPIAVKLLKKYYGGSCIAVKARHIAANTSWAWKVTGFGAIPILTDIEPFAKVKAVQVQLALQYTTLLRAQTDSHKVIPEDVVKLRKRIARRLRRLNRRGPK